MQIIIRIKWQAISHSSVCQYIRVSLAIKRNESLILSEPLAKEWSEKIDQDTVLLIGSLQNRYIQAERRLLLDTGLEHWGKWPDTTDVYGVLHIWGENFRNEAEMRRAQSVNGLNNGSARFLYPCSSSLRWKVDESGWWCHSLRFQESRATAPPSQHICSSRSSLIPSFLT